MYAIIEACGKQYKVSEGDIVFMERLDAEEGKTVTFDQVLLVSDDKATEVGAPTVKNAKVTATVIGHGKGKKIRVFKYKAKKNERKTRGHRWCYTKVQIEKISTKAPAKKAEVKANISVQFDGKEYKTEEFVKIAKDVWQYDLGNKVADFKTVDLYVKPEESAVYYVINGDVTGSFAI